MTMTMAMTMTMTKRRSLHDAHTDGDVVPDPRRVWSARRCCRSRSCGPASRGVDVVVAYLKRAAAVAGGDAAVGISAPIYEVPAPGVAGGAGLRRIARERPFDLVQAPWRGELLIACRRHGWPMVYEIHSLLDEVAATAWAGGLAFGPTAMGAGVLRHAAAIIALWGAPLGDRVVREKGVPDDRVSVIYPGIKYDAPGPTATIPGVGPEHSSRDAQSGASCIPFRASRSRSTPCPGSTRCPKVRAALEGRAGRGRRGIGALGEHGDRLIVLTGQTPGQVVALTRSRRRPGPLRGSPAARTTWCRARSPCSPPQAGPSSPPTSRTTASCLATPGAGLLDAGRIRGPGDPPACSATRPCRLAGRRHPVAEEYFAMSIPRRLSLGHRGPSLTPRRLGKWMISAIGTILAEVTMRGGKGVPPHE